MPNLYENTAKLYDIGNDRAQIALDIGFYNSIIPQNATVLEVGCGTGRVSLSLAQRGNSVTGIDLSQPMLDVFEDKLKLAKVPEIPLHRMDMRHFDLGRTYDWIIFPFRVFQALTTDEDRQRCLEAVRRHMSADSRAILTLFNPLKHILNNWGKKNILDLEGVDVATGWTVRRFQDQLWHDEKNQIIAATMRYEVYEQGALVQEAVEEFELGYLYPDQCLRLFACSGMAVVNAFGFYDQRPIRADEQIEQIYVLRRAESVGEELSYPGLGN